MRKHIFLETLTRLTRHPKLKKKLKIFFAAGAIVIAMMTALIIWAGIAGISYVAKLVQEPTIKASVEGLKTKVEQMPAVSALGCMDQAQSLLSIDAWLERPITENLKNFKTACLEIQEPNCTGPDCNSGPQDSGTDKQEEAT